MSYIRPPEVIVPVATYNQVDGVSGSLVVTQLRFNPSNYGSNFYFYFEVGISASVGTLTTTARLYNLTDAEYVTGTTLTTSATTPTKSRSAALTVGAVAGNLKNSEKIYEVRLSTNGTAETEFAYLNYATMVLIPQ